MDIQGLKDKILQLAIQGKLVAQDPNDEPASVLLERIKEEKEKLIKEGKIKKQKPLPEITEEEKPFEIPDNWEWVRLEEVSSQISSKPYQIKQSDVSKDGLFPVVSQSINLIEGYSNEKDKLLEIDNPVIVFGDHTRHVKYIDFNFIVGADGIKIINPIGIYGKYLYLAILYNSLCIDDRGYSRHYKYLNERLVPIPPLAEQKRIVEKVEELFALIDELDSNKEELLEVINLTRNQVLQLAIQGKLVAQDPNDEPASVLLEKIKEERDKLVKEGKIKKQKPLPEITEEEKPFEIPESWEWVRLGEVALVNMGQSPKGDTISDNEGIEFHQGKIFFGDKYLKKSDKFTTDPKKIALSGDILLSVRAPVGAINITDREVCIGRGLCAISSLGNIPNDYYFYICKAFEDYLTEKATGTTFLAVTASTVNEMIIPLPPLSEQKRIVDKVDSIMNMLDELEKELTNKI